MAEHVGGAGQLHALAAEHMAAAGGIAAVELAAEGAVEAVLALEKVVIEAVLLEVVGAGLLRSRLGQKNEFFEVEGVGALALGLLDALAQAAAAIAVVQQLIGVVVHQPAVGQACGELLLGDQLCGEAEHAGIGQGLHRHHRGAAQLLVEGVAAIAGAMVEDGDIDSLGRKPGQQHLQVRPLVARSDQGADAGGGDDNQVLIPPN